MEQRLNTRIITKHDIEKNWNNSNLIPFKGEFIIYDIETNAEELPEGRTELMIYPRIKVGDGETVVTNLPFVDTALKNEIASMTYVSAVDSDGNGNIVLGVAELPIAEEHQF